MKKLLILILLILIPFYAQAQEQTARLVLGAVGPDVTAPTLTSATIGADGETWTFAISESIVCSPTTDCCDAWAVTMSTAGAITFSYVSGNGASNIVCTGTPVVLAGETASAGLDYTQPGNGIEDSVGNDLASIDDAAVINNSTETTCDPATDYVGDKTNYATSFSLSSQVAYALLYVPTCDGTLEYAHVYHGDATADEAKIAVYLDDGDELPNSGDTLVGTGQVISSSAVEWAVTGSKLTGSVVTGNKYWVIISTSAIAGGFSIKRTTTGSKTVQSHTMTYSSFPPGTLPNGSWTETGSRDYGIYVSIE
jgi:hypothetical protein